MSKVKAKQVKDAFEEGFRMARQEHGRYPSEKQWADSEEAWEQSTAEYYLSKEGKTQVKTDVLINLLKIIVWIQVALVLVVFLLFKYVIPVCTFKLA